MEEFFLFFLGIGFFALIYYIIKSVWNYIENLQNAKKAGEYKSKLEQLKNDLKKYDEESLIQFIQEHNSSFETYFKCIKSEGNHRWSKYIYDAHKVFIIKSFDDDSFETTYCIVRKTDREMVQTLVGEI
jgi:hypothetical protein